MCQRGLISWFFTLQVIYKILRLYLKIKFHDNKFFKASSPITFKCQQNYVKFRLSNFFLFFSKMKINISQTTFNEGVSILPAGKSHYSMIMFVRFKDQLFLFFQLLLLYFHYFHCKWSYWSCFAVCLKITKGKKKV